MPLVQQGLVSYGSNIDKSLKRQIRELFSTFDRKVKVLSQDKGLTTAQVRLLQPLHCLVLVRDDYIFVVLSVHDVGAMSTSDFQDWSNKTMNLPTAVYLAEWDLGFKNAFGLQFPRSILELEEDLKEKEVVAQRSSQGIVFESLA